MCLLTSLASWIGIFEKHTNKFEKFHKKEKENMYFMFRKLFNQNFGNIFHNFEKFKGAVLDIGAQLSVIRYGQVAPYCYEFGVKFELTN